jgi:two-component system response regulator FixJ
MSRYIAVVDDDDAICDSLKELLAVAGHEARTFATLTSFRQTIVGTPPTVALLDVRLPDGSGVDALPDLLASVPALSVIMMTGHGDVSLAVAAMKAGAQDFLEKPFEPRDLLSAVERAFSHTPSAGSTRADEAEARQRLAGLSPREREVLSSVVEGASSKEIARRLSLSPRTVEAHRARLMSKTGADSLPTLLRFAFLAGIGRRDG